MGKSTFCDVCGARIGGEHATSHHKAVKISQHQAHAEEGLRLASPAELTELERTTWELRSMFVKIVKPTPCGSGGLDKDRESAGDICSHCYAFALLKLAQVADVNIFTFLEQEKTRVLDGEKSRRLKIANGGLLTIL